MASPSSSAAGAAAAPMQAAAWMLASTVFFASMSAMIRHAGEQMHPFEVAFFRNLFGLVFMLPWLWRLGLGGMRTQRLKLYGWRCAIGLFSMLASFTALTMIPFGDATALSFTWPLFATLGAALVLGETVRARRWVATLVGFAGVMIILRPGTQALSFGAMLALASSATNGVTALIIKRLSRTEPPLAIVIYMSLLMTPMSILPAAFVWQRPPLWLIAWMAGIGAIGSIGHVCYVRALSLADASAVTPYDYVRLLFAMAIGWYAFGEEPDIWTYVGGLVIAGAAIYIAHREGVRRQATTTAAAGKLEV